MKNCWTSPYFALLLALAAATAASAAKNDWVEGDGESDGATRDYYNRAALLPWEHFLGDWRDSAGAARGGDAYATAQIKDTDRARLVQWDVTELVRQWLAGRHQNQGFFLRSTGGDAAIVFASRQHSTSAQRPRLILSRSFGTKTLLAAADTYLTKSTYRSLGTREELRVSGAPDHALIRFELGEVPAEQLDRATLQLVTLRQYGSAEIGVFRCQQGEPEPPAEPQAGLAAQYAEDRGIERDADVLFATGFEAPQWSGEWTRAGKMDVIDTVAPDVPAAGAGLRRYEPLLGRALRVKIAQGSTSALNTVLKFDEHLGSEPEQVYFRYYVRLADDWNQTVQGGKLPGLSGTYGVAGWGGRQSHGDDGWSARGLFRQTIHGDNPLAGTTPVGTYCYHADMPGRYGDNWIWRRGYLGYLENNRWYCLEQYLQLNTPGDKDGVLRAWVDGRLAFEKTDIRFRHVDRLKIEQVWMNVYHGGTVPSPRDQHLFIDNVVVARKYIGPRGE